MALARLSVKVGKKGKAARHAAYIFRQKKYAKPSDDLEKMEYKDHGNMPKWAQADPNYFWQMSDAYERKNGSTYREHEIALPRELTADQRNDLVQAWIDQEIGDKHAYQYAIHNPPALDGGEQPHVHLMFSERLIDDIERDPDQYFKRYNSKNPERGGAKKANTPKFSADRKTDLKAQRDRWEALCNKHLELANTDTRISMKSYKDRGINWQPLNITMKQFQLPHVKAAYKAQLTAKTEYIELRKQRDTIDVSASLKHLDAVAQTKKLADKIFGSSFKPEPRPQKQQQEQEHDTEYKPTPDPEPQPQPRSRIERLKEDPEFFAYVFTHFNEYTEANKHKHDGFYLDAEQRKVLDKITDDLFFDRSVKRGRTDDWQEDMRIGVEFLIIHNSKHIEPNKLLTKALDILLDPELDRAKKHENEEDLEPSETQKNVNVARSSMRMRR